MINLREFGSHELVPIAQDIRELKTTCVLSINMVGTVIKDWYQASKAGVKIKLVCYHLTINKLTMTWSVGHVSDPPISFFVCC